jgi:hypothetical protein
MVQHGRAADDPDFPLSPAGPARLARVSSRHAPRPRHRQHQLTVGLFRAGALLATRRAATNPRATTDEVELLLDGLLRLDGDHLGDLDAIAVASVVPP